MGNLIRMISPVCLFAVFAATAALVPPQAIEVDWMIPMNQAPILANVGDTITFRWPVPHVHNVRMLSDIDDCDSWIGETSPLSYQSPYVYTIEAVDAGSSLYFACEISGHCEAGQKITVQVAD